MSDFNSKQPVKNDGIYDGADNLNPSTTAVITSQRNATIDKTTLTERVTSVSGNDDKKAMDVAISDSQGNRIDENNPLAIYIAESPAEEIDDYNSTASVAMDVTVNHERTVTTGKQFKQLVVPYTAPGLMRAELFIEDAPSAGTFTKVAGGYNSVSRPNGKLTYKKNIPAGVIIRVSLTNCDEDNQELESQIQGLEI